jgi:tRNA pseudouridine38-40 synthase
MHLLAVLEYDGTEFLGFQSQRKGRTVQEEFEKALAEFTDKRIRIVGGGRTDSGVHAVGQTASFKIEWTRDLETLQRALNAKLPRDLAVKSLREVPETFSARYSARSRAYRYTILNAPVRSPLQERFAWWLADSLDLTAMQHAAPRLIGRKDFGAFGTPPRGDHTVRELKRAEVRRDGDKITFEFEADAFLYRMVRRIVGSLVQVGRGQITPEQFGEIIERKRRAGDAAPPHGLTLLEIKYDLES